MGKILSKVGNFIKWMLVTLVVGSILLVFAFRFLGLCGRSPAMTVFSSAAE